MKKTLILGIAVFALQIAPAFAEGNMPDGPHKAKGMEKMFEMQDSNKDGFISEEEYLAFGKARFAEMDSDKDGKITKDEVKAHRDAMREKYKAMKKEREGAGKPSDDAAAEEEGKKPEGKPQTP